MNLYYFDIFEGDKGIILAENRDEAIVLYNARCDSDIHPVIESELYDENWLKGGCYISLLQELPDPLVPSLITTVEW